MRMSDDGSLTLHPVQCMQNWKREGSGRIWKWDQQESPKRTNTQSPAAWVAVPGALILLQLGPHPMVFTDAS